MSRATGRLKAQLRLRDLRIAKLEREVKSVDAMFQSMSKGYTDVKAKLDNLTKQFEAIDLENVMNGNEPAIVVRRCTNDGFKHAQQWSFQVYINEMELRHSILDYGRDHKYSTSGPDQFAGSEHAYYFLAMSIEKAMRDLFSQMMDKLRGIDRKVTTGTPQPKPMIRDRR